MQRITIAMEDSLAQELEAYVTARGTTTRSEAIRDLIRHALAQAKPAEAAAPCLAVLSCTVDHSTRDLGRRLPQGRLARHDQTVTALSVPVDHYTSLDVVVMRAAVGEVQSYAQALFAERGIRHGQLSLIPVQEDSAAHVHEDHTAPHVHLRVRESF